MEDNKYYLCAGTLVRHGKEYGIIVGGNENIQDANVRLKSGKFKIFTLDDKSEKGYRIKTVKLTENDVVNTTAISHNAEMEKELRRKYTEYMYKGFRNNK